jgi:hypothetical protein
VSIDFERAEAAMAPLTDGERRHVLRYLAIINGYNWPQDETDTDYDLGAAGLAKLSPAQVRDLTDYVAAVAACNPDGDEGDEEE